MELRALAAAAGNCRLPTHTPDIAQRHRGTFARQHGTMAGVSEHRERAPRLRFALTDVAQVAAIFRG